MPVKTKIKSRSKTTDTAPVTQKNGKINQDEDDEKESSIISFEMDKENGTWTLVGKLINTRTERMTMVGKSQTFEDTGETIRIKRKEDGAIVEVPLMAQFNIGAFDSHVRKADPIKKGKE